MQMVPDIAVVELKRLRAQGIAPTDDDIVTLATLGAAVERPTHKTAEAAGFRAFVRLSNGTILRPITVAASRWLDGMAPVCKPPADLYAVAFAMSGRAPAAETPLAQSIDALGSWAAGLAVSHAELAAAVTRMTGAADAERQPDADEIDPDAILRTLAVVTGQPAEYWERQTWAEVGATYSAAVRWATRLVEHVEDPEAAESREALRRFLFAVEAIVRRSKGMNG